MLVMSKGALTAAQAETYYEEKYSHDDYYSEKQRVVGTMVRPRRGAAGTVWRGRDRGLPRRAARTSSDTLARCSSTRRTATTTGAPDGTRPSTRPSR